MTLGGVACGQALPPPPKPRTQVYGPVIRALDKDTDEAEAAFRRADAQARQEVYAEFRARFPEHPLARMALDKELSQAWQKAEREDSEDAFSDLAQRYSDQPRGQTARLVAAERGWQAAAAKRETAAYLDFIKRYPDTARAAQARQIVEKRLWDETSTQDTREAYASFRNKFPDSPHARTASDRERALTWQQATLGHNPELFRCYALRFPEQPDAALAAERALALEVFASLDGSQRPLATINQIHDRRAGEVRLYIDVTDDSGEFIAGLSRDDMTVYEDGRQAEIVEFLGMESERPVDVVMLIDISSSMTDEIDAVKRSAVEFAELLRVRQRDVAFGLVAFVRHVHFMRGDTSLTRNAREFQQWVGQVNTTLGGVENPVGALLTASKFPFRKDAQRVFILISDEEPNVPADPATGIDAAGIGQQLAAKAITVYSITPNKKDYQTILQKAGGKLFDIENTHRYGGFGGLMRHIAGLLSTQYRLVYRSRSPRAAPGQRDVRVQVYRSSMWVPTGPADKDQSLLADLVALRADPDNPCELLAVTRDHSFLRSQDCGQHWHPLAQSAAQPEAAKPRVIQVVGDWGRNGTLFALTQAGTLLQVNVDDGPKQLATKLQAIESIAWIPELNLLWAHSGNAIYLSADGGRNFLAAEVGLGNLQPERLVGDPFSGQVCFTEPTRGLVCVQEKRWQSRQGLDGPALPWPSDTRAAFAPWRAGLLFLAVPGDAVYRSVDGGNSWRPTSLVVPGDAAALGQFSFSRPESGSEIVCLTVDDKALCSRDLGLSWKPLESGLPVAPKRPPLVLAQRTGMDIFLADPHDGVIYRLYEVQNREYISGSVYFDSGIDQPKPELIPFLRRIARKSAGKPELELRVEGHTDSDGGDAMNMGLSQRRAKNVKDILTQEGVETSRIATDGFGERRPLFPNTSAANKQRNRRVEIISLRSKTAFNTRIESRTRFAPPCPDAPTTASLRLDGLRSLHTAGLLSDDEHARRSEPLQLE